MSENVLPLLDNYLQCANNILIIGQLNSVITSIHSLLSTLSPPNPPSPLPTPPPPQGVTVLFVDLSYQKKPYSEVFIAESAQNI